MTAPRLGMCALALVNLALALGLFLHAPWATAMWPWTEQPLDYTLLSGFLAAGFGAVLWIGLTGEGGGARRGAARRRAVQPRRGGVAVVALVR